MDDRTICCIVVDDEPLAVELLQSYLKNFQGLRLIGCCHNALEAIEILKNNTIDLIFLDIKMPFLTGIEFLESIPVNPMVVFTTAHREFALVGYEMDIVDFLLKPITLDRFSKTIEKVKINAWNRKHGRNIAVAQESSMRLFVRSGTKMVNLNVSDILYVEGMKDYLKIRTKDNATTVVKKTMKAMEESLTRFQFMRVHKSYIVPKYLIRSIASNHLIIAGHKIPIGRYYKNAVKKFSSDLELG